MIPSVIQHFSVTLFLIYVFVIGVIIFRAYLDLFIIVNFFTFLLAFYFLHLVQLHLTSCIL